MIKNLNGLEINKEYSLPSVDGTSGQVMKTDGSGVLSWADDNTGAEYIDDLLDAKTDATSVFLGSNSGNSDDGTNYNVGVGIDTLKVNTSGNNNSAFGYRSLYSNTTGLDNTAIGETSMLSNTTGYKNTAIGDGSLKSNIGGYSNTAVGHHSLYNSNAGYYNTAIGSESNSNDTGGEWNTSVGSGSLYDNGGDYNVAIGYRSLYGSVGSGNVGSYNVSIGNVSLYKNETGDQNVAVGNFSLYENISGDNNSSFGYNSGRFISGGVNPNQTSIQSLYLGAETKALADGDTNEIVIGYNTTGKGSNTATLGNDSIVETHLKGVVVMGKAASAPTGVEGGIYYDTATKHFYGYDGTTWKQLDN